MTLTVDWTEAAFGAGATAFAALVFDVSHGEPFIGIAGVLIVAVVGSFLQNYESANANVSDAGEK